MTYQANLMDERRKGHAEGRAEEALRVAAEMMRDALPMETITKITRLPVEKLPEMKERET